MPIQDVYFRFRNCAKLKQTIIEILDTYERDLPSHLPPFKKELLPSLMEWIKTSANEIATWRDFDTDYPKLAHIMIIQTINQIFYNDHSNRGINLTVRYMRGSYNWLLRKCCKWALSKGYMTQAEYDDYNFIE